MNEKCWLLENKADCVGGVCQTCIVYTEIENFVRMRVDSERIITTGINPPKCWIVSIPCLNITKCSDSCPIPKTLDDIIEGRAKEKRGEGKNVNNI